MVKALCGAIDANKALFLREYTVSPVQCVVCSRQYTS